MRETSVPAPLIPSTCEFLGRSREKPCTSAIPARAAETVMVAMERAGLAALSQCRVGECGFCRSVVLGGAFTAHPAHDKRSEEDKAAGIIHPCCTYPESDMDIVVPADPAAEVL